MSRVNGLTFSTNGYTDKLVKETVTEKYDNEGNVIERTTEKVYERVYNNTYQYPNYIVSHT
jgi:hypothetical protein